jgi:hypothetical protein
MYQMNTEDKDEVRVLLEIQQDISQIKNDISKINTTLNQMNTSCQNMDTHINFIDGVYTNIRKPTDFLLQKVNLMMGRQDNTLPIKNITNECTSMSS